MFAWTTAGYRVFGKGRSKDFFDKTKSMASNQGIYNGVLVAGLIWSLFISNSEWQVHVATFFCISVALVGMWGAYTEDKKILIVQTLPAIIALFSLFI